MNIRLWKARASEKLGILKEREKTALNYADALKEKFSQHPEVKEPSAIHNPTFFPLADSWITWYIDHYSHQNFKYVNNF